MVVTRLTVVGWAELFLCWIAWCGAFLKPRSQAKGQKSVASAESSRWGIGLVFAAFLCIWIWIKPAGFEKSTASLLAAIILGPLSVARVWASAHELGKQWRLAAAVNSDHKLIQTGPYRWIRHPIYASMFGMLIATGAGVTWWPMWVAGAALFLAGTEIRVRAEHQLLEQHFKEQFRAYKSRIPAYLPFIR